MKMLTLSDPSALLNRSAARWRRRSVAWLALIAALALGPGLALAQPGATAPSAGQPPGPAAGAPARERLKQRLLALRAYRLTEELGLDPTSASGVFPVLAKYDGQLEQLTVERVAITQKLRQGPTGAAADELINRSIANRRALLEVEERRLDELRKVLTPQQTARLLVVLPEIEAQLKRQIRQIARKRGQGTADGEIPGLVDPFGPEPKKRRRRGVNE
jgi:hypothetical protein